MKHLIGTIFGFLSGFIIYMCITILTTPTESKIIPLIAIASFFLGWAATHIICVVGVKKIIKTLSRGFLIGAIEWFAVIFVGLAYSGKAVMEAAKMGGDEASAASAAIGGGLFAFLTGGFAAGMAIACLIGYAFTHFLQKK